MSILHNRKISLPKENFTNFIKWDEEMENKVVFVSDVDTITTKQNEFGAFKNCECTRIELDEEGKIKTSKTSFNCPTSLETQLKNWGKTSMTEEKIEILSIKYSGLKEVPKAKKRQFKSFYVQKYKLNENNEFVKIEKNGYKSDEQIIEVGETNA